MGVGKIYGLIVMMVCVHESACAQTRFLKLVKSLVNGRPQCLTQRWINTTTIINHQDNKLTSEGYKYIKAECPKDDTMHYYETTGLCKAAFEFVVSQNETIKQLTYKGGSYFNDDDMKAATRPVIPYVSDIQNPKDILKIAKFYKDYGNYMTVEYLKTQEIIPVHVNIHRIALRYEPAKLLDLVRPGEPKLIKERVERRIKRGLDNLYRNEEGLIVALYMSHRNCAFRSFHYEMWQQWYPPHKDLVDAILNFAHLVYKKPLTIDPYPTEKSFNADLMSVDPEFKKLLAKL